MTTPTVSLERVVARHGDALYRVALFLTDTEQQATNALRVTLQGLHLAAPSAAELTNVLPPLLATLATQQRPTQRTLRRKAPTELSDALPALPFEQRRALVLHLLLGYDLPIAAQLSAVPEVELRAQFAAGLAALAPAASIGLPSETPTEQCSAVRAAIAHTPDSQADSSVRGHLALCSACRAYDTAWRTLLQRVEAALRARLRNVELLPALATSLLSPPRSGLAALGDVVQRMGAQRVALTLAPLLSLLLIATLVLPGFFRSTVATPNESTAPIDPRTLVQRASAQMAQPPAAEGVLWHARWETMWYFPSGNYAPISAEAWLDPLNPARHRLQITHAQGGAPYELQIGDGSQQLYYALSPSYYDSLYGGQPENNRPQLVSRRMNAEDQRRARDERLLTGVWNIGASYLRQAYVAPDLRTLGRQREGEHLVQLVSYTGVSPLGLPLNAEQNAADGQVTVLLALDLRDGRLRSATELAGEQGGQSSLVTWRLQSEEWLANEARARNALDPRRAWNGRGSFPDRPADAPADPALPLVDASQSVLPERLLRLNNPRVFMPASVPANTERALVIWNGSSRVEERYAVPPAQVVYLGPGRQLTFSWRNGGNALATEQTTIGEWQVALRAARGQFYQLQAAWNGPLVPGSGDTSDQPVLTLYARGFTRAELLALMESITPLNQQMLRSQRQLFATPPTLDAAARSALEAVLDAAVMPQSDAVLFRRARNTRNVSGVADTRDDPYHIVPLADYPNDTTTESWAQALGQSATFATLHQTYAVNGTLIQAQYRRPDSQSWYYNRARSMFNTWQEYEQPSSPQEWLSQGDQAALEFLGEPGDGVSLQRVDGREILTRIQPLAVTEYAELGGSERNRVDLPDIGAMRATAVETQIEVEQGRVYALRTTLLGQLEGRAHRLELQTWLLEDERLVSLADAPVELREGRLPQTDARYITNWTEEPQKWLPPITLPISEALVLARSPVLLLPETSGYLLEYAQAGEAEPRTDRTGSSGDVLNDAVASGYALSLHYRYTDEAASQLQLIQGPVEPLSHYIRTHYNTPFWQQSTRWQGVVAGREVEGWLLRDAPSNQRWLFVELNGTLLIVSGSGDQFLNDLRSVMAQLTSTDTGP